MEQKEWQSRNKPNNKSADIIQSARAVKIEAIFDALDGDQDG